jgi:di/tricarboxylate transporter
MSVELVSILVLVLIFLISTVLPVNMGALALVGAFVVGIYVVGVSSDEILADFPAELFVILVGVTYLFAIARGNGTVDWLVQMAVRGVGGRVALIPWVMFLVTAILTACGAVVPAAVAIIAPVALGFAKKHGINPVLMSLLVINGGSAGGFSPISIFGTITNGVVSDNKLPGSPIGLFVASFLFNVALSVVVFFVFGGRKLLGAGRVETVSTGPGAASAPQESLEPAGSGGTAVDAPVTTLNRERVLTLIGLLGLVVCALVFSLDTGPLGIAALGVAVVLSVLSPSATKTAVGDVAWSTVLLICGIVTYVKLMENIGTIDYLGKAVAGIGAPLVAALVICLIGGAVSAFASTTGILGALIPLAVPFLLTGQVGAVGLILALAISASVVDSSPFSTSGALSVAATPDDQRDYVFKRLMRWGFSMIIIGPVVSWLILVVPGWL